MLDHGTEGCNYLLAVDVDMNTVDGYAISSWERGYGDMMFDLDLDTLRRTPGSRVRPRSSATCPGSTAAARCGSRPGRCCSAPGRRGGRPRLPRPAGTELEFIVFEDSFDRPGTAATRA